MFDSLPYCPVCEEQMGIDRISLHCARFLTVSFRCDAHDLTVPVTYDGLAGDLDIVMAEVTRIFGNVRRKTVLGVGPAQPVQPMQAVFAGRILNPDA